MPTTIQFHQVLIGQQFESDFRGRPYQVQNNLPSASLVMKTVMRTSFWIKPKSCPIKSFPIPMARSFSRPKRQSRSPVPKPKRKQDSAVVRSARRLLHLAIRQLRQGNKGPSGGSAHELN